MIYINSKPYKLNKLFYIELISLLILTSLIFLFITNIPENVYPDHESIKNRFLGNSKNDEIYKTPQAFVIYLFNLFNDIFCDFNTSNIIFFLKDEIHSATCKDHLYIKDLGRFFYVLITILFIVFLYFYNKVIIGKNRLNNIFYLITLIMPSVLLSITALSAEAIYTIISIFIIANINLLNIASRENLLILPMLFYSYLLDPGNFYIMLAFIILIASAIHFKFKINKIKFYFLYTIILFLLLYFSKEILSILGELIDETKTKDLINDIKVLNLDDISFYETVLRYFYFWMTLLNLYLPHDNVISAISLIIWSFVCLLVVINLKKTNFMNEDYNKIFLIIISTFPLVMINALPTHAYGKYYLFILVFIIKLFIDLLNLKKTIIIIPILSLTSICEIILLNGFNIKKFLF